jgi:5-(carboxyamino)imidazole ribonucleotide mutase|tara:strand:- start:550 stop:1011 length:462 start_codon:yes stop_codon:yes gene_type:complete
MEKKVAILLGSESDLKYVEASKEYFDFFSIKHEVHILSAHRTPAKVAEFATNARTNGYSILIGAAGMAAHLAGALKAHSTLPVLGVPLPGGILDGLDSLLATLQMPKGVPVATMTVGKAGFINAAILCAEIFSIQDNSVSDKLSQFKDNGAKL